MLSLMIGIGASYSIQCISVFPDEVPIEVTDTMLVSMVGLIISLIFSLIVVMTSRHFAKWVGIILISFYAVATVLNILTEMHLMGW